MYSGQQGGLGKVKRHSERGVEPTAQRAARQPRMATIVIGDIHGNIAALARLLRSIEVSSGDTIVFLGDYIDRGRDARGCIEAILALRESSPAQVVCLQGNHEEWLLRTLTDYSRHWNRAVLEANGWPTPYVVGNTICVDTSEYGIVTAIRMPDRSVFQSSERDTRVSQVSL